MWKLQPIPISVVATTLVVAWLTTCPAWLVPTTSANDSVAEGSLDDPISYNRDVQPILAEYCFACHGTDEHSRAAGLRLDVRDEAIDYGAIVPGLADDSELVARIFSEDPDTIMPPPESKKSLSDSQIQTLVRWIESGADYQAHWSLVPPQAVDPPAVNDSSWPHNAIDSFILSRLESEGLEPAHEAEPTALFRRLHLDITGLPPDPADVIAFIGEYRQQPDAALSRWVDELMARPAWGEHRARYWLDAARYADTHGMHFDNYREMWPYRDWVIRAFNRNQPFDEFAVEQIAGDLLPEPTEDQLIASGFNRCNMTTNEGGTIKEENLALYAADRVQTFGWVFLGLTTNCAQCHDHKFDPITAKDYYSLAAFFRNLDHPALDGNIKDGNGPTILIPRAEDRSRWNALPAEIAAAEKAKQDYASESSERLSRWLTSATADQLKNDLRDASLRLHVPLDLSEPQTLAGSEAAAATLRPDGKVTFVPDEVGDRSAALIPKEGSFALGDVGDLKPGQAISVAAWVFPHTNYHNGTIVAKMDSDRSERGYDLRQDDQMVTVHVIDQWPRRAIRVKTRKNVLKQKRWHHVAATYDGSGQAAGVKIFVDGVEQPVDISHDTLGVDGEIDNDTPLRIGRRSKAHDFDGRIRDVRIHDGVMPEWQVGMIAALPDVLKTLASNSSTDQLQDFLLLTRDERYRQLFQRPLVLRSEKVAIESRAAITHVSREKDSMAQTHLLMRGEYDQKGDLVPAMTPAALHPMPEDAPRNRLGLARWVVDPANPLTPRVVVNRFWQQVFGRGIVPTPEDFGVTGTPPSHPELLDYLAISFVDNDWDVRALFKQIFMSATYRQAAVATPAKLTIDRDNALLSRGPRFRMDAEMLRDGALKVSGLLSSKMYGPGVKPYQPGGIWDVVGLPGGDTREYHRDNGEDLYRRTIYNFWKRMAPPPNMETFGAPNREVCTVNRERTNTPLQALVMLNDEQFVEAARVLAQSALRDTGGSRSPDAIVDEIAARLLVRDLSAAERSILDESRQAYFSHFQTNIGDAEKLVAVGEAPTPAEFDAVELATWTMICNQMMNLDEVLNK